MFDGRGVRVGGAAFDPGAVAITGGSITGLTTLGVSAANVAGANTQTGFLESIDYGSGNTHNNIVLRAATTGAPNIRLQVDNAAAHVGFNIGGTANSHVTAMASGGDGLTQIRGAGYASGSDLTEYAQLIMSSTGATLSTAKGALTFTPFTDFNINIPATGLFSMIHTTGSESLDTAYGTASPGFVGRKANGAAGSLTQAVAGNFLNTFSGRGYLSTNVFPATGNALIGIQAGESFSGTAQGSYITFQTTPLTTTTRTEWLRITPDGGLALKDGITAPATLAGFASIYVDTADGDLKIRFGDGTIKTIVVDT